MVRVLERQAAERGNHPALRGEFGELCYSELLLRALKVAGGLRAQGVGTGEPVLLMLDNRLEHVLAWLGINLVGAVEVPVNTACVGNVLAHVVNDSGARIAVVEAKYLPRLQELADRFKDLVTLVVCANPGGDARASAAARFRFVDFNQIAQAPEVTPADIAAWDPMAILYTSGTTGPAKGVRITHAHAYTHCAPVETGGPRADDVVLVSLPLFHIGGQWNGVYQAWIAGATAVLVEKFSASRFWQDAARFGATFTTLLGAQASFLLRQPPAASDRAHGIRRITMLPLVDGIDGFRQRFGIEGVRTGYGITEGSSPIGADFNQVGHGSCGWLKQSFEARIADSQDREVPRGAVGELLLRSRDPWLLMDGYHRLPEKTAEIFRNQWLHTGDLFRQDESGQFFFVDRGKDVIRRRGENISSFEVEREVLAHPAVAEVAAIAVPSEHTEDDLMVIVVLHPDAQLDGATLLAFLEPRMPRYMLPRYVDFVVDLPRTPSNRVQKHLLRERGITSLTWDREQCQGNSA